VDSRRKLDCQAGGYSATLIVDGRILVVAGVGDGYVTSVEVFDPRARTWTVVGSVAQQRQGNTTRCSPTAGSSSREGRAETWLPPNCSTRARCHEAKTGTGRGASDA